MKHFPTDGRLQLRHLDATDLPIPWDEVASRLEKPDPCTAAVSDHTRPRDFDGQLPGEGRRQREEH